MMITHTGKHSGAITLNTALDKDQREYYPEASDGSNSMFKTHDRVTLRPKFDAVGKSVKADPVEVVLLNPRDKWVKGMFELGYLEGDIDGAIQEHMDKRAADKAAKAGPPPMPPSTWATPPAPSRAVQEEPPPPPPAPGPTPAPTPPPFDPTTWKPPGQSSE